MNTTRPILVSYLDLFRWKRLTSHMRASITSVKVNLICTRKSGSFSPEKKYFSEETWLSTISRQAPHTSYWCGIRFDDADNSFSTPFRFSPAGSRNECNSADFQFLGDPPPHHVSSSNERLKVKCIDKQTLAIKDYVHGLLQVIKEINVKSSSLHLLPFNLSLMKQSRTSFLYSVQLSCRGECWKIL